jgi:uncharacterized phage-associated protein
MPGPYPVRGVANAFLNIGRAERKPIDPLKLQKLVYFAHGYYIAAFGRPLIDELFEAWEHGPVAPTLYHEFKDFRYSTIRRLATEIDLDVDEEIPVPPPHGDARADRVIDFVWKTFGSRDSRELSRITHEADGPWARVRANNPYNLRNLDIPNEYIIEYFSKKIVRNKDVRRS